MAKDPLDEMLEKAEKGKTGGTYGEQRKLLAPEPPKQPKRTWRETLGFPKPVSKAPAGMANAVKGDLGAARQTECGKVFTRPIKRAGADVRPASALPYRKPAIEGGSGPRAV